MTEMSEKEENQKLKPLNEDMDARRWADEFFVAYNSTIKTDYDWMVAWFSNAIMCGYDNRRWKEKHIFGPLVEALEEIEKFHEHQIEILDKKYGFLGWTCCSQKAELAKKSLETFYKENPGWKE